MYEILKDELCEIDMSVPQLAHRTGIDEEDLRDKLSGLIEFSWSEALKIREIVAPYEQLEYLFSK